MNNGAVLLPQTMGGSAGDDQLLDYFCPTDFAPRSRFPEPSVPNKPVSNKRVFCKQTSVLYPGSILLELWGGGGSDCTVSSTAVPGTLPSLACGCDYLNILGGSKPSSKPFLQTLSSAGLWSVSRMSIS